MPKSKYKDPPRYQKVSDWYEGIVKKEYKGVIKSMLKHLKNANPRSAK